MNVLGCDPAYGPRLVFFTGGTALRDLSHHLARHTRNSVHLVTPFDSGGSSAVLRRAFAMPAVGDMRNRLLALADTAHVPQSVLDFCAGRLPAEGDAVELRDRLRTMGRREHHIWQDMPQEYADPLRQQICSFLERMPSDFEPFLASYGNLVLAGGYLRYKRDFGPILSLLGQLLRVRGVVCPIVNESLHLAAELDDGSLLLGQHAFKTLARPVRRLFLTVHEPDRQSVWESESSWPQIPCRPPLAADAAAWLRAPSAICYPMGSFYTSVLANLLPQGVGRAIAAARCPKIFIPNSGRDPECCGLTLVGQVRLLLQHLRHDAPDAATSELLHLVVVDDQYGCYQGGVGADTAEELRHMGVRLIRRHMVSAQDPQCHEPELTARVLLELAAHTDGTESAL